MFNVGTLKQTIILAKVKKGNALTGDTIEEVKKVRANVSNLYSKELYQAQSINVNISKKAKIRYLKELDNSINISATTQYHIIYKGNLYDIHSIDNIQEENKILELTLKVRGGNNGVNF